MKFLMILLCLLVLFLNCNRSNIGEPELKNFKTYLAKEVREEIEYEIEHQIETEKKGNITVIRAFKNFACGFCCNFYTGSIDLSKDSIFLIAQYGYLGKEEDLPNIYNDECTHVFEYKVENIPDTITNFIFRDITSQ